MSNYKLGELIEITSSKRIHAEDYVESGIPFYRSKEIIQLSKGENITEILYISVEQYSKIKSRFPLPKNGDILLTSVGTIGIPYLVRDENFYFKDGNLTWFRNFSEKINSKYLLFWMQSNFFKSQINNNNIGAVQKALTIDFLKKFNIQLPILETQEKINLVLTSIVTKIEINNRINAELEAMAKALYDYWFVQFDFPDANGKPYKTSGGKMVWNEALKREIPEGWEVEKVSKSTNIVDCLHSKKSDYNFVNEQTYLLQLENIKDDGLIDLSKKYHVSVEDYKYWTSRIEVIDNDIIITNAGRVAATAQIPSNIIAGIGRNITAIRPISISPTFLFVAFQGSEMKRQITLNTDSGTFFKSLNVKGIKELLIVRPSKKIEEKFENIVFPMRRKREINKLENQELSSLRDWLLPMLMNGQVSVGEVEEELGMVAEEIAKYGN